MTNAGTIRDPPPTLANPVMIPTNAPSMPINQKDGRFFLLDESDWSVPVNVADEVKLLELLPALRNIKTAVTIF